MQGDKTRLYALGYSVLGPFFVDWYKKVLSFCEEKDFEAIVCISREGYFINKVFSHISETLNQRKVSIKYLPASRSYLSTIGINNLTIREFICSEHFKGSIEDFFSMRLSFPEYIISDLKLSKSNIQLPRDKEQLLSYIENNGEFFYKYGDWQCELYKEFLTKNGIIGGKLLICDVGYRGTIQALFQKIFKLDCMGLYLMTDLIGPKTPLSLGKGQINAVYEDRFGFNTNYLPLKKSALLEKTMLPSFGQLESMYKCPNGKLNVCYKANYDLEGILNSTYIFDGVNNFISENVEFISDNDEFINNFEHWFEFFYKNYNNIEEEKFFKIDDYFYGSSEQIISLE